MNFSLILKRLWIIQRIVMNYPTPGFTMNFIVAQSKYYEYVNQIISSFRVASKDEISIYTHCKYHSDQIKWDFRVGKFFRDFSTPHIDQYWIIGGKFAVGARVDVVWFLIPFPVTIQPRGWKVWKLIAQWSHNYVRSFLVQPTPFFFLLYLLTGGFVCRFFSDPQSGTKIGST